MRRLRIASCILLFVILLPLGLAVQVQAKTGGPDPAGYTYTDNSEPDGPVYNWVEVSGSGQPLEGGFSDLDNGYAGPFDLQFPFPYYGRLYRQFYVYANGYVQLVGAGDLPGNGATLPPLPNPEDPNGVLAPFSADFYIYPRVSHIYYQYDAATRLGIIEFLDLQWCCSLNAPHTFEIILYPDGRILMQYELVRFITNPHAGYVAGIESPDGQAGLGYAAGFVDTDDTVYNGLAVLYRPGPDIYGWAFLDVLPDAQCEDAGMDLLYDADLLNLTGYTTTFTVTYAVQPGSWTVAAPAAVGPITNSDEILFPITVTIPASAGFDDAAQVALTLTAAMSPGIVVSDTFAAGVADRDLVVSKGLAPNVPPGPGGLLRYAVDVDNGVTPGGDCGAEARDVWVTETLPAGLLLVDVYPAPVITPTQVVIWQLDTLDEGAGATFFVEMRVPTTTTVPTTLTNFARVATNGSLERGPFDNNVVTYTTVVTNPWVDLWVDKDPYAGTVLPGALLTYDIAYANGGNVPAPGAIITDTLPTGVSFVTATMPFTQSDGMLVWRVGALDNDPWNPGALNVTVQVSPSVSDGFTLTNVVEITQAGGTLPDVDPSNNRFTSTLIVRDERADVWVDKLLPEVGGIPVVPEPAGDYTYWIHYGNDGTGAAISVTLTDTLPLDTSVLYASSAGGSPPDLSMPGLICWSIPTLPEDVDNWVRVTIYVQSQNADGTVMTNSVAITNQLGSDITPTNNMDWVTSTVMAADVTITKTVFPAGTITTGTYINYVVQYANVGSLEATGVVIEDFWPDNLLLTAVVTSGAWMRLQPGTRYKWDVEDLVTNEGGAMTITAYVRLLPQWPDPALVTNTVVIATSRTESSHSRPNQSMVVSPVHVVPGHFIYLPLLSRQ